MKFFFSNHKVLNDALDNTLIKEYVVNTIFYLNQVFLNLTDSSIEIENLKPENASLLSNIKLKSGKESFSKLSDLLKYPELTNTFNGNEIFIISNELTKEECLKLRNGKKILVFENNSSFNEFLTKKRCPIRIVNFDKEQNQKNKTWNSFFSKIKEETPFKSVIINDRYLLKNTPYSKKNREGKDINHFLEFIFELIESIYSKGNKTYLLILTEIDFENKYSICNNNFNLLNGATFKSRVDQIVNQDEFELEFICYQNVKKGTIKLDSNQIEIFKVLKEAYVKTHNRRIVTDFYVGNVEHAFRNFMKDVNENEDLFQFYHLTTDLVIKDWYIQTKNRFCEIFNAADRYPEYFKIYPEGRKINEIKNPLLNQNKTTFVNQP